MCVCVCACACACVCVSVRVFRLEGLGVLRIKDGGYMRTLPLDGQAN